MSTSWKPAPAGIKWKYKCSMLNGLENFVDPSIVPLSERQDLPEEAKALLFTADNILEKTGKGGIESSRWYTPPKSGSVPSTSPTVPSTPPKARSTLPSSTSTPPHTISTLDPEAKEFKLKTVLTLNPEAKEFNLNTHSTLDPEAKEFILDTVSTLDPEAKEFDPKVKDLDTVSSLDPEAKKFNPEAKDLDTVSSLDPESKAFRPKVQEFTTEAKEVKPEAKERNPAKMTPLTGTTKPSTPAPEKGLNTSRWAQSIGNPPAVNKSATSEPSAMAPLKARDVPVHLRQYYIPPHLRPVGQKATPGHPILPYIEPHQRVGILPEVIPNNAELQSYKVPPNSPVSASEKSNTRDAKSSISTPAKMTPFLASTWEEFMDCKADMPAAKKSGIKLGGPLLPTTNVIRRSIQLPPDCFSTKLAADRGVPKVEKKENVKKENMANGAPWSAQEAHTSFTGKNSQLSASENIKKAKQPELMQPKTYSTAKLPAIDTNVQQTPLKYAQDVKEVIIFEIRNQQPPLVDLTREALIQETGAAPKESPGNEFDEIVSDDGIETPAATKETKLVDSRGYLAEVDNTLQQHDGEWMPVPIDWETDRSGFKGAFIPEYITTWARTIPAAGGKVDMDCEEFSSGLSPLSLLKFEEPVAQPLCYPDVTHSENIHKQLNQCSEIDSKNFAFKEMRKQKNRERQAQIAAQQQALYPEREEIIINPNIPKIAIHLRPAQLKDIPGITSIYNHYVLNTIIPEDQTPVSEERMKGVLTDAREQGLPFVVAIKGPAPENRRTNYAEQVVGFAHTDFYNHGHGGNHSGRSRFTGVVELYVEPNHTRKGVGRSLMDRILVCSSYSHSTKEGYAWISPNPRDGPIYGHQGGVQRFHQLLMHRPIEVQEDPDHQWLKEWLHSKFFIEEAARLRSVARSCTRGTEARFLDVLTFQFEAAVPGAFDITH